MCVCARALVCFLFCECVHMCSVKLTAVGYDHPQSKETKKENQAHERGGKVEKRGFGCALTFLPQSQ